MSTGFNWRTDKKKKGKRRRKDCKINKMCSKQKRKKLSRETREVETKRRETDRDGEPARSLTWPPPDLLTYKWLRKRRRG